MNINRDNINIDFDMSELLIIESALFLYLKNIDLNEFSLYEDGYARFTQNHINKVEITRMICEITGDSELIYKTIENIKQTINIKKSVVMQ